MTRHLLAVLLVVMGTPLLAQANPSEEIIQALVNRGYRIVLQERTWLGRERVVAETTTKRRELVFNPGTGEIMRDFVIALDDADYEGDTAVTGTATVGTATVTGTNKNGPVLGISSDEKTVVEDPVAPVVSPIE